MRIGVGDGDESRLGAGLDLLKSTLQADLSN